MTTYWCRIIGESELSLEFLDSWTTGYIGTDTDMAYRCFAIRADDPDEIHDLLLETLPGGGAYEVDFIEERPTWETYRAFAGPGTRFPMAEKHLGEEIDSIDVVRKRAGLEERA